MRLRNLFSAKTTHSIVGCSKKLFKYSICSKNTGKTLKSWVTTDMKHNYLNSDRYFFAGLFQAIWKRSMERSLRTHVLLDFKSKHRPPLQLQNMLPLQADLETVSGHRVTSATLVIQQCYGFWLVSKAVEIFLKGYIS